jgi:hypothetical protein
MVSVLLEGSLAGVVRTGERIGSYPGSTSLAAAINEPEEDP